MDISAARRLAGPLCVLKNEFFVWLVENAPDPVKVRGSLDPPNGPKAKDQVTNPLQHINKRIEEDDCESNHKMIAQNASAIIGVRRIEE